MGDSWTGGILANRASRGRIVRANRGQAPASGESWTGTSLAVGHQLGGRIARGSDSDRAERADRRIGDRHPSGGGSGTGGSGTGRIGDRHPLRPSRAEGIKGGGGRARGSWTRRSWTGSLPRQPSQARSLGGKPLTRLTACFAEGAGKPGSRSRGGSRRAIRPVEPRHGIRVELRMRLIQSPRPGGA